MYQTASWASRAEGRGAKLRQEVVAGRVQRDGWGEQCTCLSQHSPAMLQQNIACIAPKICMRMHMHAYIYIPGAPTRTRADTYALHAYAQSIVLIICMIICMRMRICICAHEPCL